MEDKLLSCPFCGSVAEIVHVGNEFFPKCKGDNGFCLLNRPLTKGQDGFIHIEDAIEVWNKRKEQFYNVIPDIVVYAKQLGFVELPHFIVGGNLIYDLSRGRYLSLACGGTSNEMLFICTKNTVQSVSIDAIVIHNYDYDGYLTKEKLKNIINVFNS